MTAQFSELLMLEGKQHSLCSYPLASYFALGGESVAFRASSTALSRGYIGTWEILDQGQVQRLYLIRLQGWLQDESPVSLETVFSGYPQRVFAHWFSGTLRLPQGQLLHYVHGGFGSCYEQDLLIDVTRGVVTAKRVRVNGFSDEASARDGYRIHAMTTY
jgi:hypothetical protein